MSIVNKTLICGVAGESKASLNFLRERIEAGDIKAVIDRIYPLEQTAEAHRYVDTGRKKGNVVISVKHKETNKARLFHGTLQHVPGAAEA